MYYGYKPVSNKNQGSFNNPRQKTWMVMGAGKEGWGIIFMSNSFEEVKEQARQSINRGVSTNNIMVMEVVPIDTIMTPSV